MPCVCVCQAERRYAELAAMGVKVKLCLIGSKGIRYFKRRPQYDIASEWLGLYGQQLAACL